MGPLTERELELYDERGFVVLHGIVSPAHAERLRFLGEIERGPHSAEHLRGEPRDAGPGTALHERHRDIAALTCDSTLAGAAKQILADEVRVFESGIAHGLDHASADEAFRSDFEAWHRAGRMPYMRAVCVVVVLSTGREGEGPLLIIPGSHRLFVPRAYAAAPAQASKLGAPKTEVVLPGREPLVSLARTLGVERAGGPAGTVVLLDVNVLYRYAGRSNDATSLFFVLNASSNGPSDSSR